MTSWGRLLMLFLAVGAAVSRPHPENAGGETEHSLDSNEEERKICISFKENSISNANQKSGELPLLILLKAPGSSKARVVNYKVLKVDGSSEDFTPDVMVGATTHSIPIPTLGRSLNKTSKLDRKTVSAKQALDVVPHSQDPNFNSMGKNCSSKNSEISAEQKNNVGELNEPNFANTDSRENSMLETNSPVTSSWVPKRTYDSEVSETGLTTSQTKMMMTKANFPSSSAPDSTTETWIDSQEQDKYSTDSAHGFPTNGSITGAGAIDDSLVQENSMETDEGSGVLNSNERNYTQTTMSATNMTAIDLEVNNGAQFTPVNIEVEKADTDNEVPEYYQSNGTGNPTSVDSIEVETGEDVFRSLGTTIADDSAFQSPTSIIVDNQRTDTVYDNQAVTSPVINLTPDFNHELGVTDKARSTPTTMQLNGVMIEVKNLTGAISSKIEPITTSTILPTIDIGTELTQISENDSKEDVSDEIGATKDIIRMSDSGQLLSVDSVDIDPTSPNVVVESDNEKNMNASTNEDQDQSIDGSTESFDKNENKITSAFRDLPFEYRKTTVTSDLEEVIGETEFQNRNLTSNEQSKVTNVEGGTTTPRVITMSPIHMRSTILIGSASSEAPSFQLKPIVEQKLPDSPRGLSFTSATSGEGTTLSTGTTTAELEEVISNNELQRSTLSSSEQVKVSSAVELSTTPRPTDSSWKLFDSTSVETHSTHQEPGDELKPPDTLAGSSISPLTTEGDSRGFPVHHGSFIEDRNTTTVDLIEINGEQAVNKSNLASHELIEVTNIDQHTTPRATNFPHTHISSAILNSNASLEAPSTHHEPDEKQKPTDSLPGPTEGTRGFSISSDNHMILTTTEIPRGTMPGIEGEEIVTSRPLANKQIPSYSYHSESLPDDQGYTAPSQHQIEDWEKFNNFTITIPPDLPFYDAHYQYPYGANYPPMAYYQPMANYQPVANYRPLINYPYMANYQPMDNYYHQPGSVYKRYDKARGQIHIVHLPWARQM